MTAQAALNVAVVPERQVMTCPVCGHAPMSRVGGAWSGLHLYQNYRCSRCGRKRMNTGEVYIPRRERHT